MAGIGRLLRFARGVVQGVLNQINQQMNVIQEAAMSPINQMVQATVNGAWRGRGADAFVREMQTEVLPGFTRMLTGIGNTNTHINRATEIMSTADSDCASRVGSLVDTFRSIF